MSVAPKWILYEIVPVCNYSLNFVNHLMLGLELNFEKFTKNVM